MSLLHNDTDIGQMRDKQADEYEAMCHRADLVNAVVLVALLAAIVIGWLR